MDPDEIIETLGLEPHPEGGRYRETWRAPAPDGVRASGTAIYFLLRAGEVSRWHRVDGTEVWHHYAGAPLELRAWTEGDGSIDMRILGSDLGAGERPQLVVDPGQWQTARSLADWTLVGCTVSPGFEFGSFTLAPPGWEPPVASGP